MKLPSLLSNQQIHETAATLLLGSVLLYRFSSLDDAVLQITRQLIKMLNR